MEEISIRQLSDSLKWSYSIISTITCRTEFNKVVQQRRGKRTVKLKDIPEFTNILYEFMAS